MNVIKIGFPSILNDNDETYFSYLNGYIESLDSACIIQMTRTLSGINVRVSPSHPKYIDHLIQGVKDINNRLGIIVDFSKSMKTSSTINFNIKL